MSDQVAKLQEFKSYVHKRLDEAGVPSDPESPHRAEGCRIGGRLDVLIGERDYLRDVLVQREAKPTAPEQWAVVELMGHVKVAGRVSEEERFGAKLGRIDVPTADGGFVTQHFSGASVYRVTYVDEAAARIVAGRAQVQPVHSWELPKALPAAERDHLPVDDQEDEDDEDDGRPPF